MGPLLLRPPAAVPAGGLSSAQQQTGAMARAGRLLVSCSSCLLGARAVTLGCTGDSSAPRATLVSACSAGRPHPEWGSRNPRSISLIFVITGVEAGDNRRRRRSSRQSTCWPDVGGMGPGCCRLVDISTAVHRSAASSTRCPRSVPALPPAHPQAAGREHICTGQRAGPRPSGAIGRMPRRATRSSPTCAHSWGQLLYLSTVEWPFTHPTPRYQAPSAAQPLSLPVDKATGDVMERPAPCRAPPRAGERMERLRCRARGERSEAWGAAGSFYWRARLLIRAVSSVTWV